MTSQVAYNPIGEIRLIMEKQTKKEECYKKAKSCALSNKDYTGTKGRNQ